MKRVELSRSQMEAVVRAGTSTSVAEVCARYGISPATYFRWKKAMARAADTAAIAEENRCLRLENDRMRRELVRLRGELFAVRHVLMGKLRQRRSGEAPLGR